MSKFCDLGLQYFFELCNFLSQIPFSGALYFYQILGQTSQLRLNAFGVEQIILVIALLYLAQLYFLCSALHCSGLFCMLW